MNQYEVITDASGTPVQLISTITFYASISIYNFPAYSQIMKYLNTLYSCSLWISLDFHSRKSTPQKVFDFYWLQDPSLSIDEYLIQTESSELFIYSSSLSKSIFYCNRPIKLFHTLNLKYCIAPYSSHPLSSETTCKGYDSRFILYPVSFCSFLHHSRRTPLKIMLPFIWGSMVSNSLILHSF